MQRMIYLRKMHGISEMLVREPEIEYKAAEENIENKKVQERHCY